MSSYVVLFRAALSSKHSPTGRTRHSRDGVALPVPSALEIVKYRDDPGFYLLYLDGAGKEMTDTCHDSSRNAMAQAEWEFGVALTDWVEVSLA
jgi:hypothetical protein